MNLDSMHDDKQITKRDHLVAVTLKACNQYRGWSGFAGGLLLGLAVNAFSDPNITNYSQVANRLFSISRPLNWLSWAAVGVMLFTTLGRIALDRYSRRRSYEMRLAHLYRGLADESIRPFQRGRIALGKTLTIQSSPDLHGGWPIERVRIQHDVTSYMFPSDMSPSYSEYLGNEFYKGFADDRTRLLLVENPVSFTDLPTLRLKVQHTKWSQIRFYQDRVINDPVKRQEHIEQVLQGHIRFPNSLALHLIVATCDGYVLLTKTSLKVHYYPDRWACSIGEHLDVADLTGPDEKFTLRWVERALSEELGVSSECFEPDNVRIMAVTMESQIINFAIVGIVVLNHDKANLNAIIDKHPRSDYEFQAWDFISWDDIPKELAGPTRDYHPSTETRMFYAGLYKFDAPQLNRRIMISKNRAVHNTKGASNSK